MLTLNIHGVRYCRRTILKPPEISRIDNMREVPVAEASEGDRIRLTKDERDYEGILMPHHRFSGEDIITLKLDNGYNIGLKVDVDTKVVLLERGTDRVESTPETPKVDKGKPQISIIGTGGTIASYVEYGTGAVHPAETAAEVLYSNPEIALRCNPTVKILLSKLSENITPNDWVTIADAVLKEFDSGAKGVVIAHGTDTMGYTSAALSFLLDDIPKPVVLVGSQRSSDRPSSDAPLNLLAAIDVAKSNVRGVYVVMHEAMDDKRCAVHHGTKVRKMHTSRRDAFKSINTKQAGWVEPLDNGMNLEGLPEREKRPAARLGGMEPEVAFLYVTPALTEDDIVHAGAKKGIVLVGTGLGHMRSDLIPVLKEIIDEGKPVVMTSQCLYGTVNNYVYANGRKLLEAGVITCGDMLPETALVKLMWALSISDQDVKEIMTTNVAGEMSDRRVE